MATQSIRDTDGQRVDVIVSAGSAADGTPVTRRVYCWRHPVAPDHLLLLHYLPIRQGVLLPRPRVALADTNATWCSCLTRRRVPGSYERAGGQRCR